MTHGRRTEGRRLFTLLAALLAASASGCASTKAAKQEIVWPVPPDMPRIRYVRSIGSAQDLNPSFWVSLWRALVPSDSRGILKGPNGLALGPDEKVLYVTNPAFGTLVRVDLERGSLKIVGDDGPGRLVLPFGVAVDRDSNVYASDQLLGEVHVFDKDGAFLRLFGKGILEHPTTLALDRKAGILYAVNGSGSTKSDHRIEAFSLDGKHLRTIGTRGHAPGEFNFPSHIAVDREGNLYVSDMLNFRVQVFDRDGRLLTLFGTIGAGGPGQFEKSKGIAFDTFGNVYVADALHGVQIFNRAAQTLMSFGEGFMQLPTGIVIDSRNHIYVSDPPGQRVHEFVLFNTTQADSFPPGAPPAGDRGSAKRSKPPAGG